LTPLHVAARSEYAGWDICFALLSKGANINARDIKGNIPADLAVVAEQSTKVAFLSSQNNNNDEDGIPGVQSPIAQPTKSVASPPTRDAADEMLKRSLADVACSEAVAYDEYGFEMNSSESTLIPESSRSEKQERQCATKWITFIKDPKEWERAQKKGAGKIRDMVYHGIPRSVRGDVWCLLMTSERTKGMYASDYYQQLLAKHSNCMEEIDKDIARTFRAHELFATPFGDGQKMLQNILRAYSVYDSEVGYCQGMSEIAAVCLMNMSEVDSFWALVELMAGPKYAMRELFLPEMRAISSFFNVLSRLVEQHLPKLHDHFEDLGVNPCLFATKWFMTMFSGVLPFGFVVRLWDVIIYEGTELLFTVALRILELVQKKLLSMPFEDILQNLLSLKHIHQYFDSVDAFITTVTRHPISHNEISQLKLEQTVESFKSPPQQFAKSNTRPLVDTSLDDSVTPLAKSSSTLLDSSPSTSPGNNAQKDTGLTMFPCGYDVNLQQNRTLAQSAPLMIRPQPKPTSSSPGSPSNGSGPEASPVVFSPPLPCSTQVTAQPQQQPQHQVTKNRAAAAVAATIMPSPSPTINSSASKQTNPVTAYTSTPPTTTGSTTQGSATTPQQTAPAVRSPSSAVLLGRIKFS